MRGVLCLFLTVLLFSFGCGKPESGTKTPPEHPTIVGAWQLTDYFVDPGNGTHNWQKADPANPLYIGFTRDGELSFNNSMKEFNHYEILSDSTIRFTSTAAATQPVTMRYIFTPQKLRLFPPCIEGCEYVYKPVFFFD
jgi:hypothetical protein